MYDSSTLWHRFVFGERVMYMSDTKEAGSTAVSSPPGKSKAAPFVAVRGILPGVAASMLLQPSPLWWRRSCDIN